MTKRQYGWKIGSRFQQFDPNIIGTEIYKLDSPTAHDIVQAASNINNPLHPMFEWDDKKAATSHRLDTAMKIARNLTVVIVKGDTAIETRAFECVIIKDNNCDNEKHYMPIEEVIDDTQLLAQVVNRIKSQLETAQRQLTEYRYLSPCFYKATKYVEKAVAIISN